MRRWYQFIVLALLLMPVFAQSPGPILRAGLDVDVDTFDPRFTRNTTGFRMNELIFNGLVSLDETITPQPDLAERWEFVDNQTVVFHLRPGVTFHNGQPFTARDVKFTLDSILDPNSPSLTGGLLRGAISGVEVLDDFTVQLNLSAPFAPLLQLLDLGIVPENAQDLDTNPVGTGPFQFVSRERGNSITLAANENYFKGAPALGGIQISIIADNNVRLLALESGDLDLVHSPLPPQDIDRLAADPNFVVAKLSALGYTYLGFNTLDPIFADVRVRQALAYLADKNLISEQIFFGQDQPGLSPLIPGTAFFSEDVFSYSFDPEMAEALLTEAGWVDTDGDGIRDKDGQPLSFTLRTNIDPNRSQILELLQGIFGDHGIEVKTSVEDFALVFADVQAGNYQSIVLGWLSLVDPDRAFFRQFTSGGGANYGTYLNPTVEQLIVDARRELDGDARRELYRQAADIIAREAPYVFLTYQGYQVIHSPRVQGFVPSPAGSWRSMASTSLS